MYLTYQEYQDMGGTLDEAAFNDFEFEAECLVDWYTFNRLKNDKEFPVEVKRCVKELIKYLKDNSSVIDAGLGNADNVNSQGLVSSYSNDGVSVTYNVLSASEAIEKEKEAIANKIRFFLQGVTNSLGQKVLYRGLYPGE